MSDVHFYIDDSGTRHPDRSANDEVVGVGDWFALGGILIDSDDEQELRDLHGTFCDSWGIDYPLHSSDIRFQKDNFEWLKEAEEQTVKRFYSELEKLIFAVPALGLACVIDRPGYNARYREVYGRQRWSLCKTAFTVGVERAAKFAASRQKRIRIYAERSDPKSEKVLKAYYDDLRSSGMPFANGGNEKYRPLEAPELGQLLREFRIKRKSSPPMQMADLFLYPICKGGYVDYKPLQQLYQRRKLVDSHLSEEERPLLGLKYSCFELVGVKPKAV